MDVTQPADPINSALRTFEAVEANLQKVQRIWSEIQATIPDGIVFGGDPKYDERVCAYEEVLAGLPKIDGWKPESVPMDLDAIGQCRLDAKEVGEIEAEVSVERTIEAPGRELADYRHRLNKKRRQLIRKAMPDAIARVDDSLTRLKAVIPREVEVNKIINDPAWEELRDRVRAIGILLGSSLPQPSRWDMLLRHLHFGMVGDFRDIERLDWPAVKSGLTTELYGKDEPLPVQVEDIGKLAATEPRGIVATKLNWRSLNDEELERLIFTLISTAPGYENALWLTRTNAPDRGRDLSVDRVARDALSGVMRNRVIVQCRHWLSKSIALTDVSALLATTTLWEPPSVDTLIITTSGRFTTDAVDFIEKHNLNGKRPHVEMWAESHLERLLAEKPWLVAEFKLR